MDKQYQLPGQTAGLQPASESLLAVLWQQFKREFPSPEHCLEELCRRATQDGIIKCRHCGSQEVDREFGKRVIVCRRCRQNYSLTAGTFFHHMRLPQPWLAAIWLMERGVSLSSAQFEKLAGVAYATAWHIHNKLTIVIQGEMTDESLALPSSLFSALFCKRSRETPARSHPRTEEEEIAASATGKQECNHSSGLNLPNLASPGLSPFNRQSASTTDVDQDLAEAGLLSAQPGGAMDWLQMSDEERRINDLLAGQELHFDVLCARSGMPAGQLSAHLTMLELAGHVRRLVGDSYVRAVDDKLGTSGATGAHNAVCRGLTHEAEMLVACAIKFVREHYHGISRKYVQNYLAGYWCHVDRRRWQLGSLLQACLHSRPIGDDEIRHYVSPALVRIPLCL